MQRPHQINTTAASSLGESLAREFSRNVSEAAAAAVFAMRTSAAGENRWPPPMGAFPPLASVPMSHRAQVPLLSSIVPAGALRLECNAQRSRSSSRSSSLSSRDSEPHDRASRHEIGGGELEDLVECLRESVERDSFCRQQQQQQLTRAASSSRSSSSASHATRATPTSSPGSTCELVTALQNHLKSAVAAATAAAAAANAAVTAAAANSAQQPQQQYVSSGSQRPRLAPQAPTMHQVVGARASGSSNKPSAFERQHPAATPPREHSPLPLDLKIPPEFELWHAHEDPTPDGTRPSSAASERVQHAETVQTSYESEDAAAGPGQLSARLHTFSPAAAATATVDPAACHAATSFARAVPPSPAAARSCSSQAPARPAANGTGHGHGHVKQRRLYKCRHCPFETDKKIENWQHIRIHMRPEKLLSCGSCLFVTEYKHHLEYHQRNHTGYKPFKCEHCDYTCVNKSMLNSHMKSHSSVYQYQCGDCKYATKYVHSLKMHLRKYDHQPAAFMIDIFGRKRGPKPGSGRKQQQQQQQQQQPKQQQDAQGRGANASSPSGAPANGRAKKQSARQQQQKQQQQQQQQQQCILDLRVDSKLAAS